MPSLHHTHPEPEERSDTMLALTWTPKFPAQFAASPEPWKPLIARCKEMQQKLALSDGAFTGPLLNGSAWNQLCNGAYRIPTTERGIATIKDSLTALAKRGRELLEKQSTTGSRKLTLAERFVHRPEYQDVLDALEDAERNVEDDLEERVVLVVGDTRSGKTSILAKLMAETKVHWKLSATPVMKRSYKQFLIGIGEALKIRGLYEEKTVRRAGGTKENVTVELSEKRLQAYILNKLDKVRGVLAIQELQSFSPAALEFLKLLLNDTQVSLILFLLPEQYERMVHRKHEDAKQFIGRSVGVVKLAVTEQLVADFNPQLWKSCPEAKTLQKAIALEANKGGSMSLVRDVCRDLALLAGPTGVQQHHVTDALADFRRKIPEMMERRAA